MWGRFQTLLLLHDPRTRLDIRTHSHDVEEALRREEEALLAAAAALDGCDAPSKQYQQQQQQPRRSASRDGCVGVFAIGMQTLCVIVLSPNPQTTNHDTLSEPDAHGGGGGGDDIDDDDIDDDDDRAALLPRPGTPSALPRSIVHAHASGGRGSVGQLLPLACGHNTPFSEGERARLVFYVASQGWSLDAFGAS